MLDSQQITNNAVNGKCQQEPSTNVEGLVVQTSININTDKCNQSLWDSINQGKLRCDDDSFIRLLRTNLIKLRPAEKSLRRLTKLCNISLLHKQHNKKTKILKYSKLTHKRYHRNTKKLDSPYNYSSKLVEHEPNIDNNYLTELTSILDQLSTISNNCEVALPELQKRINHIANEVLLRIEKLNYLYSSVVCPAISKNVLLRNMVAEIGHQDLKKEAQCHLNTIQHLSEENKNRLNIVSLNILSGEAQAVIGTMIEIEEHRLDIEELLILDRKRQSSTVKNVSIYIAVVIALAVLLPIFLTVSGKIQPIYIEKLNQHMLPFIGIPWPVIVWSLIGSFAATIHRFNSKPVYEFRDTIKWMITRHVQGVVLSSAFYLVLVSGLFLLTGVDTTSSTSQMKNELILVLCFLIGFSDRFVNSVFDALVRKYSKLPDDNIDSEKSKKD
ncbi:hypothetical protein AMR41_09865 [Hapalosiphon sp. MRB220]|nr:hypothetical protein AMR41_09865 [Hapalosiphon sp. MRB220]